MAKRNTVTTKKKQAEYLVRPGDFMIFEIDKSNGCYRSQQRKKIKNHQAQSHFTYENLVDNYNFLPIKKSEIEKYKNLHDLYYDYRGWESRSDGHGGSEGGTMEEWSQRFLPENVAENFLHEYKEINKIRKGRIGDIPAPGTRIKIPVYEVEFNVQGNTIWIQSKLGTMLRIKCTGEIKIDGCTSSPMSHSDVMVSGDIHVCLSKDVVEE